MHSQYEHLTDSVHGHGSFALVINGKNNWPFLQLASAYGKGLETSNRGKYPSLNIKTRVPFGRFSFVCVIRRTKTEMDLCTKNMFHPNNDKDLRG